LDPSQKTLRSLGVPRLLQACFPVISITTQSVHCAVNSKKIVFHFNGLSNSVKHLPEKLCIRDVTSANEVSHNLRLMKNKFLPERDMILPQLKSY